jgi:hypothetical protein
MSSIFSNPRRDDVLANLSLEQRERLNQWLRDGISYAEICDLIAQPPPVGFSVKTSDSAVRRYYRKNKFAEDLAEANEIISQLPNPTTSLKNLLHQSALTTALKVELPPATFQILARHYRNLSAEQFKQRAAEQRDRQLQLIEDRLNHHRRVFEFNAARAALAAACELQQIANDPQMDDEQKIWAARSSLFGALPDNQPQPKQLTQFIQ